MGQTSMFGKTYNTVGSTDSNFLIKTKGDLKVQWGGKYINLIKNGKLATSETDILKTIEDPENIAGNGIYYIPSTNEVWVCIDNKKVNIVGSNSYVSFLVEQNNITSDQKYLALTNAGLYYNSLDEAKQAGIKAGIIFVEEEKKLYIIKDGQLQDYLLQVPQQDKENKFDDLYIGDLHIYQDQDFSTFSAYKLKIVLNDEEYMSFDNRIIKINCSLQVKDRIQSEGATENSGFRLYNSNGSSTLEVDNLVWRNKPNSYDFYTEKLLSPIIYNKNNIILTAKEKENNLVECYLKYTNEYEIEQYVYVYLSEENSQYLIQFSSYLEDSQYILQATIVNNKVAPEDIVLKVIYDDPSKETQITIEKSKTKGNTTVQYDSTLTVSSAEVIQGPENVIFKQEDSLNLHFSKGEPTEYKIVDSQDNSITIEVEVEEISKFLDRCQGAMVCLSRSPMVRINNNTIEILDRTEEDDTLHSILGQVQESEIEALKECPQETKEVKVGIYSDNFIGLNSKLYDTVFKKLCGYPKYDDSIEIPEDVKDEKYDQSVPNIAWIKELLKLAVPKGTIAMFNGSQEIPEGWAICDGTNGTPNLVGKFIKGVGTLGEIGANQSELNENNELVLTQQHLPEHTHPHTHSLKDVTTDSSGELSVDLVYSDYNWGIDSYSSSVITSVSGEGVTSTSGSVSGISSIHTQGGSAVGGDHSHTISGSVSTNEDIPTEWTNKPIKIEPRSYSLVFIMKL